MTKNLVINGKPFPQAAFAPVNFDGDRIPLPARFSEHAHLIGNEPIGCLLLVITSGRYQLMPTPTGEETSTLKSILRQSEELSAQGDALDATRSNANAAIRARLIPTLASPMGTSWRVTLPKEARMLVPANEDQTFIFVMVVAGFVELWFPDTLRRAVSVPIAELLS